MVRITRGLLTALSVCASPVSAQPGRIELPPSKYQITEAERATCQNDAVLFCSTTFPDEDALIDCMKTVRPKLTTACRTVFEAGLKRRHIPF